MTRKIVPTKRFLLQSVASVLLGAFAALGGNAWATNPLDCDWTTNAVSLGANTGGVNAGGCGAGTYTAWYDVVIGSFSTGVIGRRTTPTFKVWTNKQQMGGTWANEWQSTGADTVNPKGFACGFGGVSHAWLVTSSGVAAGSACPLSGAGARRSYVSITQGGTTVTSNYYAFTL